jgi:hypothetical protein
MDKFFHSTFDFFSHALPGLFLLVSLVLFDPEIVQPYDIIQKTSMFKINDLILVTFLGYVVGFAIHPVGQLLYKKVGSHIWHEPIVNHIDMFISDKYVLIRQFSPVNFKYVETWNMFCSMSHNLAVSCLISATASTYKIFFHHPANRMFWIMYAFVSIIMFLIFLKRAVRFSTWATHDLNAAISRLKLNEKANENTV